MRILVDTNVLLRSAQPTHPLCSQATNSVARLMRDNHSLFVCPQNIAEFWNVATRPADRNGLGSHTMRCFRRSARSNVYLCCYRTLRPFTPRGKASCRFTVYKVSRSMTRGSWPSCPSTVLRASSRSTPRTSSATAALPPFIRQPCSPKIARAKPLQVHEFLRQFAMMLVPR